MTYQEKMRLRKKIVRAVLIVPGVFFVLLTAMAFVQWDWTWPDEWRMGDRFIFLIFWVAGSAVAIGMDNFK